MSFTVDQIARKLEQQYGIAPELARQRAIAAVGELTAEVTPISHPIPGRIIEPWEVGKLEKEIQHKGNMLMRALGFDVVSFSQPRASKQTPGIADTRYRHPRRRLAFWWEWKAADGEQSPDQAAFQAGEEACGQLYGIGGFGDLKAWLEAHGVASFGRDGTPHPTPIED